MTMLDKENIKQASMTYDGGVNVIADPVGRAEEILALWVKVVPINPPAADDDEEAEAGAAVDSTFADVFAANALKVCGM